MDAKEGLECVVVTDDLELFKADFTGIAGLE